MIRTYRNILSVLMVLLAMTVAAAFVDLDRLLPGHGWNLMVAMTIAIVKALLIAVYFMHLRYGKHLTWAFAGAGFLWLAILLLLTMSDYTTRDSLGPLIR